MKDRLIEYWEENRIISDSGIIEAFRKIRREDFIPKRLRELAYDDSPLPIGHGQTISQPTTIVMMLEALRPDAGHKVLEIGAGTGYNAALLSCLSKEVCSVEPIKELVTLARKNLARAGITNVKINHGDGSIGFQSDASFDRIIVTCAVPKVPKPLEEQLREGGVIVVPVGPRETQRMLVGKKKSGSISYHSIGYFRFVPLVGKFGYVDPEP